MLACVAVHVLWAAAVAVSLTRYALPAPLVQGLEIGRLLAWSAFAMSLLRLGPRGAAAAAVLTTLPAAIFAWSQLAGPSPSPVLVTVGALCAAVLLLVSVEQVYRSSDEADRWALKFLCVALAASAAVDVALFGQAWSSGAIDPTSWAARGYAHVAIAPLIAVSAARVPSWRLSIRVSRDVVFHSAILVASGLLLLTTSLVAYGMHHLGTAWASVAATMLWFAAIVGCALLLLSGRANARLRMLLVKNFFAYRFDYRTEWIRLTEQLARASRPQAPDGALGTQALRGLARFVNGTSGALWMRSDDGDWRCAAMLACERLPDLPADAPLALHLSATTDTIDLDAVRSGRATLAPGTLPPWLESDSDAALIVPLALHAPPIGFAVLRRPIAPLDLDWEVHEVLRTAAHQIAGYLAIQQAIERLVEARQFESFNRMSAFVVHDLKNLVAQLSLMMRNAERHRDDPRFRSDMLETVGNVIDRMRTLLVQLRSGSDVAAPVTPVPITRLLRDIARTRRSPVAAIELDCDEETGAIAVFGDRDRLERIFGHLVENAQDAMSGHGTVRIRIRRADGHVLIDVVDTGCGMSAEFIQTRLFRPFVSTKEHGMGLGAFECREYLREIGGTVEVESRVEVGTRFTVRLPALAATTALQEV